MNNEERTWISASFQEYDYPEYLFGEYGEYGEDEYGGLVLFAHARKYGIFEQTVK